MGTAGGINAVARHPSCPDHGCVPPFAANWAQDRGAAFDQHDAQRFRAGLAQARLLPAWEQDKLRDVLALLFGDAAAGPDRPRRRDTGNTCDRAGHERAGGCQPQAGTPPAPACRTPNPSGPQASACAQNYPFEQIRGAVMTLANVRKARAGTDSAGHRWPADGAVIAVPVEHALAWTRIPDGGFSIIETPPAVGTVPAPVTGVTDVVADDIDETGPDGTEAKPRTSKAATRRS